MKKFFMSIVLLTVSIVGMATDYKTYRQFR